MLRLRVILVEPKYQGNVGAVARLCQNFDVAELVLVGPPELGDEAKMRSMHAWDFLQRARRVDTFEEAVRGVDFLVGTTAKVPTSDKKHLRNPVDASDLPARLADRSGLVGLAFGREDFGLLTPELEVCDLNVTIPTSSSYRALNLSHAVAVVLYEFFKSQQEGPVKTLRAMDGRMRDALYSTWDEYIESLQLAEHKVMISKRVIRKLLGRAVPSGWEFFVLMGLLRRGLQRMGKETSGEALGFEIPAEWKEELRDLFLE
jgi:tRNA/rRNA methyltransferase